MGLKEIPDSVPAQFPVAADRMQILHDAVLQTIDNVSRENDLGRWEIIGVLEVIKQNIHHASFEENDE